MNQFYRAGRMGLRRLTQKLRGWEEVYTIGFRPWVGGQSLPEKGEGLFAALPYDPDYWYADPILFEHEGESWLFCEAFDRRTAKGVLAVCRFEGGLLTRPQIILREHCHLSFPMVFRWQDEIFLIPETGSAHSLCLYRCTRFPDRWQIETELYTGRELCDTIVLETTRTAVTLLCSETDPANQLRVRWQRFALTRTKEGYRFVPDSDFNEAQEFGYADRNAGPLIEVGGKTLHVTQYSTDIDYGVGLRFAVRRGRVENPLCTVGPQNVRLMGVPDADRVGVHTYSRDSRWEVVDLRYALPSPEKFARARARRKAPFAAALPGPGHSIRFAFLQIYCGASGKPGSYNAQEIGLAKALAALGHTCVIFYPDPARKTPEKENLCPGVDILWLPARTVGVHAFYRLDALRTEHIQAVHLLADNHLFAPSVHRYCQKHGILCYNYLGAVASDSTDRGTRFVMDLLARRNLRWFAKTPTFAKTPALAERLEQLGVPGAVVAPVALDISVIPAITDSRTKLRRALGLPVRGRLVLFVGRLDEYKNPLALPDILAALPADYRMVVIGDGALRGELVARIDEAGLSGRFFSIPHLPNAQIHAYYHACNVLINLNSHEIFGMSILEALYAGCPVVARHAPGPDLIIREGQTGFLTDRDADIPARIVEACTPAVNSQLGAEARRDILTRFTWEHTAQLILDTLQNSLSAPAALPESGETPRPAVERAAVSAEQEALRAALDAVQVNTLTDDEVTAEIPLRKGRRTRASFSPQAEAVEQAAEETGEDEDG